MEPYGTFGDEERPLHVKEPIGPPEKSTAELLRCLFVEFLGLTIFVYVGSMSGSWGGDGTTGPALAHGVAIFVLVCSMGHISGGHFNPAITLGILLSGAMPWLHALLYAVAQLLGGILGALFVRLSTHGKVYTELLEGGVTTPGTELPLEAITCEMIFTFFLVNTVLLTAVDTDKNILAPLAIGFSILVDIFAGGNVSGASMNPARSFGPAVVYSIFGVSSTHWNYHYVYWIGPLLGGAIASVIYRAFLARDDRRWLLR